MEVESSLVASQNAIAVNPAVKEPQREADVRQQQEQRQTTEFPRTQVVVRQGTNETFNQAERFREERQAFREPSDSRARQALEAYQSLEREEKRSEIQQTMGVDTFV